MPLEVAKMTPVEVVANYLELSAHLHKSALIQFPKGRINFVFSFDGKNYLYEMFDLSDPFLGSLYTISLFSDGFYSDHRSSHYLKKHAIQHHEFIEWLSELIAH